MTPNGPSIKFHVTNVHTMSELKFSGNCLKGSRPIVQFDAQFDSAPHLQLIKEIFLHVFPTPNLHPRSKPFIDHIINFYICDHHIWLRNYQITEEYIPDNLGKNKIDRVLVEIGPRFVLNPVKILSGSFFGAPLYENPKFVSPSMIRAIQRNKRARKFVSNIIAKKQRIERKKNLQIPTNELDTLFADADSYKNLDENGISENDDLEDETTDSYKNSENLDEKGTSENDDLEDETTDSYKNSEKKI